MPPRRDKGEVYLSSLRLQFSPPICHRQSKCYLSSPSAKPLDARRRFDGAASCGSGGVHPSSWLLAATTAASVAHARSPAGPHRRTAASEETPVPRTSRSASSRSPSTSSPHTLCRYEVIHAPVARLMRSSLLNTSVALLPLSSRPYCVEVDAHAATCTSARAASGKRPARSERGSRRRCASAAVSSSAAATAHALHRSVLRIAPAERSGSVPSSASVAAREGAAPPSAGAPKGAADSSATHKAAGQAPRPPAPRHAPIGKVSNGPAELPTVLYRVPTPPGLTSLAMNTLKQQSLLMQQALEGLEGGSFCVLDNSRGRWPMAGTRLDLVHTPTELYPSI